MAELEVFLHDQMDLLPNLIKAALAHVQFETIHTFLDGNGRVGRLLISLGLRDRAWSGAVGGVVSIPTPAGGRIHDNRLVI